MHGLYLLWWVQEKQMSPVLVATVLAAADLALMGLEFPTGWFADRFGRRASLILGSLVQVVGMLWCWLGDGVSGLVTASVLIAFGDAFRSGADEALLYSTCRALGREGDFQRIEARSTAITLVALVLLILAGGVIVTTGGFAAGWLAETLLCVVGLAVACAMVEPSPQADEPGSVSDASGGSDSAAIPYRALALFIAPVAVLSGAASAASFLAQTAETMDAATVTMLVAAVTAAEAGGSALAAKLRAATIATPCVLAICGAGFCALAFVLNAGLPVVAIALGFMIGVAQPLRAAAIQRLANDRIRARAASAASACDMAVSTLVLPLAGVWRSRW